MPIAFARARFLNITSRGGACKTVAYLGRKVILDRRLDQIFDYEGIANDLVYETMILPNNAPFRTPAEFANALDEAERRRQRRSTNRERWPQFGAHLIFALPPDTILTVDEAAELVDRLVRVGIGGSPALPAYVTIHDPALAAPGAVNRHAHVLVGLREIDGTGLSRRKVRHLFAHPRHAAGPNVVPSYVAEGLPWPDIARDLQNVMFAEVGSNALVDPPAPVGGRHWSAKTLRHSPDRRARHDETVRRQNVELVEGDPPVLVARMMRGRSAMRIDEVRRLLARFLDSEEDRQWRLDRILTNTEVVTLASDGTETKPRWLTTKIIYDAMCEAVAVVDRAATARSPGAPSQRPALEVIVASGEETIVAALSERLSGSARRIHRPLVIGQKHSDCRALAAEIGDCRPTIGTFNALEAGPRRNSRGGTNRIGLRYGGFIVVPHVECVGDQDLAALLLRTEQYGARLLLGYDVSRGAPSNSLAARLADKLCDRPVFDKDDVTRHLRAGLVHQACRALYRDNRIHFGAPDRDAREAADFVVCDDEDRLAGLDRELQSTRSADSDRAVTGLLSLVRGQCIVYTAGDFNTEHIRAGRFAKVIDATPLGTLEVIHTNGAKATLDLKSFPPIRSAYAISIREARHAPKSARLLIETTKYQYAWSVALLAASRAEQAIIHVDSAVAKNLKEWIAVVSRSKPAPLLTDLTLRDDPLAEINALMRRIYSGATRDQRELHTRSNDELRFDEWVEAMPDLTKRAPQKSECAPVATRARASASEATDNSPALAPILSEEQRRHLNAELRAAMFRSPDTRLALQRLRIALAPCNERRHVNAENLLRVCPADGPMAALLRALLGRPEEVKPHDFDDLELPAEMMAGMPRNWGLWEMWQFGIDLRTMASSSSNWPIPSVSSEPEKAAAQRFAGQSP